MRNAWIGLVLAGCATVTPVYGPDGKPAFLVECGGRMANCHQAALEKCKGPYATIGQDGGVVPYFTPTPQGGIGGAVRRFELTVRCQ